MQTHHIRVQVGENRNSTDDSLSGNAETQNNGQAEKLWTSGSLPHHHHKHANGDDDEKKGQQPVTKLDETVKTHFRCGHKRFFSAAGPGGATQARAGQAHRATGPNNQRLADKRRPGKKSDATRHSGR